MTKTKKKTKPAKKPQTQAQESRPLSRLDRLEAFVLAFTESFPRDMAKRFAARSEDAFLFALLAKAGTVNKQFEEVGKRLDGVDAVMRNNATHLHSEMARAHNKINAIAETTTHELNKLSCLVSEFNLRHATNNPQRVDKPRVTPTMEALRIAYYWHETEDQRILAIARACGVEPTK